VPAMAATAAHVTMLQRTPTYIAARPAADPVADFLRDKVPAKIAYTVLRWKNVLLTMLSYQLSKRRPQLMKNLVRKGLEKALPSGFDIDTHFTPPYNPWDQRFCIVPDGDLFKAISAGTASVVTGHIETFTPTGIRLVGGEELPADIVVTATGLNMLVLGGVQLVVDGAEVKPSETVGYRGAMFSGVPNLAAAVGYTNASWTLRADLSSRLVCKVLNEMKRRDAVSVVPVPDRHLHPRPLLGLSSGYIQRALDEMPQQGDSGPWRVRQNYLVDATTTLRRDLGRTLHFESARRPVVATRG